MKGLAQKVEPSDHHPGPVFPAEAPSLGLSFQPHPAGPPAPGEGWWDPAWVSLQPCAAGSRLEYTVFTFST